MACCKTECAVRCEVPALCRHLQNRWRCTSELDERTVPHGRGILARERDIVWGQLTDSQFGVVA